MSLQESGNDQGSPGSTQEDVPVESTQRSMTVTRGFSIQSGQLSQEKKLVSALRSPPRSPPPTKRSLVRTATPSVLKKVPLIPKKTAVSTRRPKYIKSDKIPVEKKELLKKSEGQLLSDKTIRGESGFLERLEEYRGKRLQRICYCESNCWVRTKDVWTASYYQMKKYFRALKVVCCPPLCTVPKRIAFWPPPRAYFFFRTVKDAPRKRHSDDKNRVAEIVQRKKTYLKLKKATRESMDGTWKVGISHPCMEDIPPDVEAFVLKTSRNNFIGCVLVSCGGNPRFSMIYSHPSGSDLSDHLLGVPNLRDMARFYRCDVYSYDYSGYGISTGSPTEDNQNADIRALYQHLTETKSIPPMKIVIMGYSIGTCASVDLVCELSEPPAGLILEAPPLSILRVLTWNRACFGEPWKTKTCCMDRFSTFDKIGQVKIPTLVIHGTQDHMVPFQHGKLVHERAPMAVDPCWMTDVDHDSLENYIEVWKRIRIFLKHEVRGATPLTSGNNTPQIIEKKEKIVVSLKKKIKSSDSKGTKSQPRSTHSLKKRTQKSEKTATPVVEQEKRTPITR